MPWFHYKAFFPYCQFDCRMSSFAIGFSQYALYGIIDINADENEE
ncbi:hypothetical protein CLOLEP_00694 [[Clostridium] leptum DSM 753]|uniref:Uncharacterized protein n=1 Tax=[Clostridium] leptum DSM 753 TaxID=428125 RepID=A7VQ67_9FIRM|nr:hypothetical protein CLOLEP_00694 [[Clostridium] leptum DSM 753]